MIGLLGYSFNAEKCLKRFRRNNSFSKDFLVDIKLYQGFELPLPFIIKLEVLSLIIRLRCHDRLLYVDHLTLVSENSQE